MRLQTVAAMSAAIALLGTGRPSLASTVTVVNACSYQIAVGIWPAAAYQNGGWFMSSGTSVSFPSYAAGTGGRIWSRHNCVAGGGAGEDICTSGTCGGSGIQCAGTTSAGVSEAEINFNGYAGNDYYDVSYVDGINDIVSMYASGANQTSGCTSKPACGTGIVNDGYDGYYSSSGDSCQAPCSAAVSNIAPYNSNTALYCCTGATYGTSAGCNEPVNWNSSAKAYVNDVHAVCTGQYAYQYDDAVGLSQYPTGQNYTITFCGTYSSGGSSSSTSTTSSSSSSGGGMTAGTHQLAPECATGSRLDDPGSNTANGTGQVLWGANGGSNQKWAFAASGTGWNAATLGPYCLDDNNKTNAQVVLWACNGGSNQVWNSSTNSDGSVTLTNGSTGQCLDDYNNGTGNGNVIGTWGCNSASNQKWILD